MGGFFGAVSKRDCILDVFFGTDYHSHLGTRRGGMAAYDPQLGLQREIHNIENSPFKLTNDNKKDIKYIATFSFANTFENIFILFVFSSFSIPIVSSLIF